MSTSTRRWQQRPEGSTWGDFGDDDQLGRLNLLTPAKVRQGVAEVREGLRFSLSLPLDYPGGSALNPNRKPPVLRPLQRKGLVNFNCLLNELEPGRTDVLSDDMAILSLQYSTQWDGLAHAGSLFDANADGLPEPLYYNGFAAGIDVVGPSSISDTGMPTDASHGSTSCVFGLRQAQLSPGKCGQISTSSKLTPCEAKICIIRLCGPSNASCGRLSVPRPSWLVIITSL